MKYQEIFAKDDVTVLITGDSLAYNRYGYDPEFRTNARDCGAGMPSWAFSLRDRIYRSDPLFVYGEAIPVDCDFVYGLDYVSAVPHTAVFGGRIKTLYPKESAACTVPVKGSRIVLYLQHRLENSCVFDVFVDGKPVLMDVDISGSMAEFAGFGLMTVVLPCEESPVEHRVEFRNIRGADPKITLAGVGSRNLQVLLTGRGGECADYFVEHFDERIGLCKPDLLILSLGANDRGYRSVSGMQKALVQLYGKLFAHAPQCSVLHLLPPSSHCPEDPDSEVTPYTSLLTAEAYNRAMEAVSRQLGKEGFACGGLRPDGNYPIETMRISELFDDGDVSAWRFDNIHLNPHGNDILLEALCKKLWIP